MSTFLVDYIKSLDMEKIQKAWQQFYDGFSKVTGAYKYPNGMLGETPLFIESFGYSTKNSVTIHKTFVGVEISDNISVDSYGIDLEIVTYGDFYIDQLEKYLKIARESNGQQGITALYYNKFKELYGPLVITDMSLNNTIKETFLQRISIKLTSIEVRKFVKNDQGIITTETLGPNNFFPNQEILETGMPVNWYDEVSRSDKFKEIENAITNKLNL